MMTWRSKNLPKTCYPSCFQGDDPPTKNMTPEKQSCDEGSERRYDFQKTFSFQKNPLKDKGDLKHHHLSGSVQGSMEQGKAHGVITVHGPKGQVIKRVTMDQGQAHGPCLLYEKDGKTLKAVLSYDKGVLEGMCEFYHKGVLLAEIPHHRNKKHGRGKFYNYEGNLVNEIDFHENKRHGDMISYDDMGHVVRIMPYEHDKKHGTCQNFYPSGEMMKTMEYAQDKKHGKEVSHFRNGHIYKVSHYKNGKLLEPHTVVTPKGDLLPSNI